MRAALDTAGLPVAYIANHPLLRRLIYKVEYHLWLLGWHGHTEPFLDGQMQTLFMIQKRTWRDAVFLFEPRAF